MGPNRVCHFRDSSPKGMRSGGGEAQAAEAAEEERPETHPVAPCRGPGLDWAAGPPAAAGPVAACQSSDLQLAVALAAAGPPAAAGPVAAGQASDLQLAVALAAAGPAVGRPAVLAKVAGVQPCTTVTRGWLFSLSSFHFTSSLASASSSLALWIDLLPPPRQSLT